MSTTEDFKLIKWVSILGRQFQHYIVNSLSDFNLDLCYFEYICLINLYEHNGVAQEFLSKILYIDKSAITRSIQSLEKKGYLYREKNKNDKRVNNIILTEKAFTIENLLSEISNGWEELTSQSIDHDTYRILENSIEKLTKDIFNKLNE